MKKDILEEMSGLDCSKLCSDHKHTVQMVARHDEILHDHEKRLRVMENCKTDYEAFKDNYMRRLEDNIKIYGLMLTAAQIILGILIYLK